MINIENKILQKKLTYEGTLILKYRISYPQIRGFDKFNMYNYRKAIELQNKSENELYEEAKKTYEYNKQNGYPTMVYEIVLDFLVTYNYNNMISLYSDEYIFSGGAHGNTTRTSQTWNIKEKKMVELQELLKRNPNFVSSILKEINEQIAKNIESGNNIYFEDYCCLTSANFRVENYYLYGEFIAIYYQQYDIAPYSSGIISFFISMEKI